jgi:hypothetical protein
VRPKASPFVIAPTAWAVWQKTACRNMVWRRGSTDHPESCGPPTRVRVDDGRFPARASRSIGKSGRSPSRRVGWWLETGHFNERIIARALTDADCSSKVGILNLTNCARKPVAVAMRVYYDRSGDCRRQLHWSYSDVRIEEAESRTFQAVHARGWAGFGVAYYDLLCLIGLFSMLWAMP